MPSWSFTSVPMLINKAWHAATLIVGGPLNGYPLISGGTTTFYGPASAAIDYELYSPSTDTWGLPAIMLSIRTMHTSTRLNDGCVLIVGGASDPTGFTVTTACEIYDPAFPSMAQPRGSLHDARFLHNAVLLPNGKVLVIGGAGPFGSPLNTCELYDPTTGLWTYTGTLHDARAGQSSVLLTTGKVLTAGGQGFAGAISSCELYDPSTGLWTYTQNLPSARWNAGLIPLNNGKTLSVGGQLASTALAVCYLYNSATGTWASTGSLHTGRYAHASVLLNDGRVMTTGGYSAPAGGYLGSTEIYDQTTESWTADSSLNTARSNHTMTVLSSGNVLVAGGLTSGSYLASAELYVLAIPPTTINLSDSMGLGEWYSSTPTHADVWTNKDSTELI